MDQSVVKSLPFYLKAIWWFICLGPLVLGVSYSLLYSLGVVGWQAEGLTLKYWVQLLSDTHIWSSIGLTILLTVASIIPTIAVSIWLSWQIASLKKAYRVIAIVLLIIPLGFPPLLAGYGVYQVLNPAGLLAGTTHGLGINPFPQLVHDAWWLGVLCCHLILVIPVFTLVYSMLQQRLQIADLHAQSTQLGSHNNFFYTKIYFPTLLKQSLPLVLLYVVFLMGTYEVPLILAKNRPETMAVFIAEHLSRFDIQEYPVAHGMAVLYSLLLLSILFLMQKVLFKENN